LPGRSRWIQLVAEFGNGDFVVAREAVERKAPVFFEVEKLVFAFGGSFGDGDERIVDVIKKDGPIGVEELAQIEWERVYRAIDDQFVGIVAPGEQRSRRE
jgi:hypothetical protein